MKKMIIVDNIVIGSILDEFSDKYITTLSNIEKIYINIEDISYFKNTNDSLVLKINKNKIFNEEISDDDLKKYGEDVFKSSFSNNIIYKETTQERVSNNKLKRENLISVNVNIKISQLLLLMKGQTNPLSLHFPTEEEMKKFIKNITDNFILINKLEDKTLSIIK